MSLDEPIAANCTADYDDMNDLINNVGYFGANDRGITCSINLLDEGWIDYDGDGIGDFQSDDTICYHSNITTAFLS